MTVKINLFIEFNESAKNLLIQVWDVDVLVDDKIESKSVNSPGPVEFLINSFDTGELNPEFQIRIFDENGDEIFRTEIDKTLTANKRDLNTGFVEQTTIDFGKIKI
jgi:hypothetical protein